MVYAVYFNLLNDNNAVAAINSFLQASFVIFEAVNLGVGRHHRRADGSGCVG